MKVVHVLKKIESIDNDIKDLRKMEKALQKNKSFTTPIYLSIEKQINILLGDRIKLLELKIENPPESLVLQFEEKKPDEDEDKKAKPAEKKKIKGKKAKPANKEEEPLDDFDNDNYPLLTQDMLDEKMDKMQKDSTNKLMREPNNSDESAADNDSVKLLDIALEKGTLNKHEIDKEKKKIKFFRDNFPGSEY
jgi:hypothetical protein